VGDAALLERLGGRAVAVAQQREQQVLGVDQRLLELAGLLLGVRHGLAGPVGEALEHG
jgi:hypothetical protein